MKEWFHISRDWKDDDILVYPRVNRVDDENCPLDTIPFIAVTPCPAQCLVALGIWQDNRCYRLYKTLEQAPKPADWVFDYQYTSEHRYYNPVKFNFVVELSFEQLIQRGVPDLPLSLLDVNMKQFEKNISKIIKCAENVWY